MRKRVEASVQKTALVYCRVSTKGQEEKTSLGSQADACVKHAESLGYTVGRVTKETFSGAELWDRPQLAHDRADIKAGQFQALVCYATDRLSRDPIHLALIAEECERAGVELVFVTEPLDSSPEGALIRYVKGYASQMEREKIKERMLRGRKSKLLEGKPTFHGWSLYGYRPAKEEGRYEIYEPEAEIVRRVFQMYAEGYGCHAIASRFNREQIPSPKAEFVGSHVKWSGGCIHLMLKNPSYKGEEHQWRTKRNAQKRDEPRPQSEWVRMPDGCRPAIISPALWEAAQAQMRANKGAHTRNKNRPVLLRGLIHCGHCGTGMIRSRQKQGKYEYDRYRCGTRWRPYKTTCKAPGVPVEKCHEWAWQQAKAILLDPEIIEREYARLEQAGPDPQLLSDLATARARRERVEKGLQALIRRFRNTTNENLWPFIEREIGQAGKEKEQLEGAIRELESRLKARSRRLEGLQTLKEYSSRVCSALDAFTFEEKRLAFAALGMKVYANGSDLAAWEIEVSIQTEPEPYNVKASSIAMNA